MRTVPATTIGAAAARALATAADGRILAVFRRSFYVDLAPDAAEAVPRLVCVGPPAFGPGPLNLLAPAVDGRDWGEHLEPGAPARRRGQTLAVADLCLDFSDVAPWRAPSPRPATAATLAAGLGRLAEAAAARRPSGLGRLVVPLCRGDAMPADGDAFLIAARPAVAALAAWARDAAGAAPAEASRLLGLGPGLTPSGDDFLCGFLAALAGLGRRDLADRVAGQVLPRAGAATNAISHAALACAAEGEVAAPLAAIVAALTDDVAFDSLLDRVETIGHSSGWDCLAGIAAAAAALADTP